MFVFFVVKTLDFYLDIDECIESDICGDNTDCSDTEGSYTCQCKVGYARRNRLCVGKYAFLQSA